jgi:hypothetical protein
MMSYDVIIFYMAYEYSMCQTTLYHSILYESFLLINSLPLEPPRIRMLDI